MLRTNTDSRRLVVFFIAVVLVGFLPASVSAQAPQDVIGVFGQNRTGTAGAYINVPVFVRDVIGTPAGRDRPACTQPLDATCQQIADVDFQIRVSDVSKIAGCSADPTNCFFREAGLLTFVRPEAGTDPCPTAATGCFVRVETKTNDSFTYTLATRTPLVTTADPLANLIGFVRIKLAAGFTGTVNVDLVPAGGFLGGTDNASAETVANGFLALNSAIAQRSLVDVDANGTNGALTDGLLVIRRLFAFSGTTLVGNAIGTGANRSAGADVQAYIESVRAQLDIDGNGTTSALTDGLLLIRFLFGFRGATLITGAVGTGATRTTAAAIEAYIAELL